MTLELKKKWDLIDEELSRSDLSLSDMKLLPTSSHIVWGEVLVGLDSKNRRHVIVPVPDNAKEEREDNSQGISIEVRPYIVNGKERLFCDIACRLAELNQLFAVVAQDIIDHLLANPESSPFPVALKVLERWRQLLERAPGRLLSRERLSGLVGELLLLEKLGERSSDALEYWVGPDGARHDFVSSSLNIEVKASTRQSGRHVKIQSLEQLSVAEGQKLFLYFIKMRVDTGSGLTLPELIDRLIENGLNSIDLHKKLLEAGYHPDERERYLQMPLEVVETLLFQVSGSDFPRLIPALFPDGFPRGIEKISYEINLDASEVEPLPEGDLEIVLLEMIQ